MAVALQSEQTWEWTVPEYDTVGKRLRAAREFRGITLEHMALVFGKSTSTISKWENDLQQPRGMMAVIDRWAEETRVYSSWIKTGVAPTMTCFGIPSLSLVGNPPNDPMQLFDPDDFGLEVPYVTAVTTGA
jgi:transcriptional regulator with XRE-family HTH domain